MGPLGILGSIADRILSLPGSLVLVLVFALPALEASAFIGFVFPGEIAVLLGGVVASQGRISLWSVILAAASGAIIGDTIGYFIGRRWGTHLLHGTLGRLPVVGSQLRKHLPTAQAYVRRRRGSAVFFGRFTAALRVLVPGLAGMSDVHYPSFLAYNVAGGALWGTGFAVLGYVAGASYQRVERIASRVGLALLGTIVVGLIASRLLRRLGGVERVGDRLAATRPAAWVRRRFPGGVAWTRRRLAPQDPRGFGLTFTIALGAFAAWMFGALTQDVVAHDEAALIDPRLEAWVVAHRTAWLTGGMKVITRLGSLAVIVPAALIVGSFLLIRRRELRPAAMLAAAVGGAVALVHIVSPMVDRARPRPAIWLGHFSGPSFPSGHVTQAVACCGMLAMVLGTGRSLRARSALWTGAALVTVVVGASRIYLGANWMTDVLAGSALGTAWVAVVVLVVLLLAARRTAARTAPDVVGSGR